MKKGKGKNGKLLPNSLRIISSCIKTVSTNASTAVRSAGATVAASIASSGDDRKEQVLWAGFDKLELSATAFRRVLLLAYVKGFQVFDVEEASSLSELVSRRDGPVTFLQMLPSPVNSDAMGKYKSLHPILVVVAGNENEGITSLQNMGQGPVRYSSADTSLGAPVDSSSTVRFYSMKSNEYIKAIDFKSMVLMVRCSQRVVAIGLEEQICCLDSHTLEKKFIVATYPVSRMGEQGVRGINTGYGPMSVGPRWLAYPPNRPFMLNTSRVSPQILASSVSPSTSPASGTMMARYAVEPGKHLANGLLTGCKKLSKYCPELLPDTTTGKLPASESEFAGVVAVKDLVCSDIISQFRAHTSPISALCFDPSGTLLVTASIHGNNINVFRIMPSHKCGGSSKPDWSTSYAHLYKLHRGITSAVIQDICFSHCSRWVAIVSSRGTCHIFVLSPFGGDDCFQSLIAQSQGNHLFSASTPAPPWWSASSFSVNQQHSLRPPPCTLSVVARMKSSESGLINSVSNAAASMAGKLWVPSGAVAAIFHNSNSSGSLDTKSTGSSLGHILIHTSSGFVVQHEILYTVLMGESKTDSVSARQINAPQIEEYRVRVEPNQWWDVCRRLDAAEREECISGSVFDGHSAPETRDESRLVFQDNSSVASKRLMKTNSLKSSDKSQWYLSNAEVQINSSRLPVWHKSKMRFHVLELPREKCYLNGEIDIEMAPTHEIEIRQKDLLPIFDNFPRARSGWIDRPIPSSNSSQAKEKINEASIVCLSQPPSCSSTESSDGGSSRRMENLLDLDHVSLDRCQVHVSRSSSDSILERDDNTNLKISLIDQRCKSIPTVPAANVRSVNFADDNAVISRSSSMGNVNPSSNTDDTDSDADLRRSRTKETVDLLELFNEGYCNKPEFHDQQRSIEGGSATAETNANANNQEEENSEEGWIGGMFDFS
ncbi:autophagy-related protein 18g-like isoform X1 [Andrographis paniculata]|uniref:autophagy-related protein 18g-like isoform X1 n=1 Tax=Andrographis paniculata TaxID=175694 RepID=UPI0021E79C90|nr:autophagy-related protein 18g-like isoform X1 [Andrographis paniculata]XP_051141841.1 autophagy-related protein 18g-like isoform X1 [Andrographis paniculata]